jgi:DNA-binding response OmpR family regulator
MQSLPPRLLVVEDDVTVARALSRTLARVGYSVALARSCAAARSLAQSFDLAILDLDLPDGNGADLARALISEGKVPSVLFFTGSSDTSLLARARGLGSVVMKSLGTSPILAWLSANAVSAADAANASEAPQSGTAPNAIARSYRASSASSLRRSRAR